MSSIWLSLKENANCIGKSTDVHGREDGSYGRNYKNWRRNCVPRKENAINNTMQRFYDLDIGDPSRNIIEMIFKTASMKHSKRRRNIERVLRVKNPEDTLGRFEEYREMVKRKAHNIQYMKHPRSAVDGNELLRFYNTAMTCCSKKLKQVSELCHNPNCGVCTIIQSGFNSDEGIQLSASSEIMRNDIDATNAKKAMVVCRVIAGRVFDDSEEGSQEEFDSVGSRRFNFTLDQLFVRNPSAILPCFIIIWA